MKNAQHNFAREATFSKSLYSHSLDLPLFAIKGAFAGAQVLSSMEVSEVSDDSDGSGRALFRVLAVPC
jgi:hypothetical protein